MKYIFQFLVIMVFAFIGEVLHHFIPLPVPASIYGIVLLFLALELRIVKVSDVKETSSFLIAVMPLMFLPPASKFHPTGIVLSPKMLILGHHIRHIPDETQLPHSGGSPHVGIYPRFRPDFPRIRSVFRR
ncbi:MAG: CidA/LrgA family protein [Bacteroidales bacterium]|nr:CidA/LrgA family protein [Bacteroidales bacterium]